MRRLIFSIVAAFLIALGFTVSRAPEPLKARLIDLQLEAIMPQQAEALHDEAPEVRSLLLKFAQEDEMLATKAWLALVRYPDMAQTIFLEYGDDPLFQEILFEHGEQVIPPIHYFMHNESPTLLLRKHFADAAAQLGLSWNGAGAKAGVQLTPAERGRYAIRFIAAEGHGFLGQFVIANDGSVARVESERISEEMANLFTGGIRNLETRTRRGDDVRASDAGWAAVDVAIGVSAVKLLRLGKGAAAARTTAVSEPATASLGSTLLRGSALGLKAAKMSAPLTLGYIVVRHPSLLNSLFGELAETFGYPVRIVQIAGWTLVLTPLILLLQWLLRPIALLLSGCAAIMRRCDLKLSGRRRYRSLERVEPVIPAEQIFDQPPRLEP